MRIAKSIQTKSLWDDWLTKYAKRQQALRDAEDLTLAESLFEDLEELGKETCGSHEFRPGRVEIKDLLNERPDQSDIAFKSALERDFILLMSGRPSVASIEARPVTIRYMDDCGKEQIFVPNFLVTRYRHELEYRETGFHNMLVEVKHSSELEGIQQPKLLQTFNDAKRWAEFKGWSFSVFTEKEIQTTELVRARELLPYRFTLSVVPIELAVCQYVRQNKEVTISEIGKALDTFPFDQVRTEIFKMLATHQLIADFDQPLDDNLLISDFRR